MTISLNAAAQHVCGRGGWDVSNLALQKILYMAQLVHLGRVGQRLINADFEAWDYGPVQPDLYQKVKFFGDRPIQNIFFAPPVLTGTPERVTLDEACDHLIGKKPGELVAITHWKDGAWARNYRPGVRGIIIPDQHIVDEYNARTSNAAPASGQ